MATLAERLALASVLDTLKTASGEESPIAGEWEKAPTAGNAGKKTTTGYTTTTAESKAAAVRKTAVDTETGEWFGRVRVEVLPEIGQWIAVGLGLSENIVLAERTASGIWEWLLFSGGSLLKSGTTAAGTGDAFAVILSEGKAFAFKKTAAGSWTELGNGTVGKTSEADKIEIAFGTEAKSGVACRLTNFSGGELPTGAKTVELKGALSSSSTLTGNLTRTRQMKGALSSSSTLTGKLTRTRLLAGALSSPSSLAGALTRTRFLKGALSSPSTLTGKLETSTPAKTVSLAGSLSSSSTLTGKLIRTRKLAGALSSASSLTGKLIRTRMLRGALVSPSSLTGELTATHILNRLRVIEKPPMRQYLIATTPGGHVRRWGEDEPEAADVLEELTDSDTAPGGHKSLTAALPRKPGTSYADMQLGTKLEVFGAGQYKVSEYRLERNPRTSGDYLVVDPAASGYQTLLTDDEGAREIFVDAEQGAWGTPPTERLTQLNEAHIDLAASQSVLPVSPGEPAGVGFDFANVTTDSEREQAGEAWYDAAGIWIGSLVYFFRAIGGYDLSDAEHWLDRVLIAGDQKAITSEAGENHHQDTNAVPVTFTEPYTGRVYAILESRHLTGASGNTMNGIHAWQGVKVIGRHGLTLYGTWPELGVLASDVIAYALSMWAPGLRFTTGPYGSIKPSSFAIPHLVFKEPTTVQEMVTAALKFELLEWGVWPGQFGPTFYLNERGQREGAKRWRARVRPAKLTETGQQMDQLYNRVVMSWQDPGGTTMTLGPIDSGYPLTDSRCEDQDPESALNEAGVIRTKHLTMNGVGTVEGAANQARLFLEKCRQLDSSGEATLTGFVEDDRGIEWPYYCVHAGDEIEFLDSSISGPRYIVEATRSRKSRSVNIKLDVPPDSYQALLEDLQVRETAAG